MADTINLHKSYAAVNSSLAKAFDENGVKRSFTVPYIDGQETAEHVQAVGKAAAPNGGLTKNIITTAHHSAGKGYGSGDGETVGHSSHDLQQTVIRKDDEHVKSVLSAAQTHLNNIAKLVGKNNPTITTANNQLKLIKTNDAAGMTFYDLGVGIQNLLSKPLQAVARAHGAANGGAALEQNEQDAMSEPQEDDQQAAPQDGAPPEAQTAQAAAPPEAQAAQAAPPQQEGQENG